MWDYVDIQQVSYFGLRVLNVFLLKTTTTSPRFFQGFPCNFGFQKFDYGVPECDFHRIILYLGFTKLVETLSLLLLVVVVMVVMKWLSLLLYLSTVGPLTRLLAPILSVISSLDSSYMLIRPLVVICLFLIFNFY